MHTQVMQSWGCACRVLGTGEGTRAGEPVRPPAVLAGPGLLARRSWMVLLFSRPVSQFLFILCVFISY